MNRSSMNTFTSSCNLDSFLNLVPWYGSQRYNHRTNKPSHRVTVYICDKHGNIFAMLRVTTRNTSLLQKHLKCETASKIKGHHFVKFFTKQVSWL